MCAAYKFEGRSVYRAVEKSEKTDPNCKTEPNQLVLFGFRFGLKTGINYGF